MKKSSKAISPKSLGSTHVALHRWYKANGRHHLPWRQTTDPYHIWVSEVMLQQTQVKTVLERFYFPFLEKFPTVEALAKASEQQVLKAWQGLGYYTRARNLHKAAKQLVNGAGLVNPASRQPAKRRSMRELVSERGNNKTDLLLSLPGVGQNTAHAILAFGFQQPVPVMEANVKRILARVFALEQPSAAELWEKAESLLDRKKPFDYNQAMMDVGSLICLPKTPRCGECPLNTICAGKKNPERYPQKKPTKKTPVRERIIVLFQNDGGKIFLEKRDGKFLAGLYGFKEYEAGRTIVFDNKKFAASALQKLGSITHMYSHFTLKADVYVVTTDGSGNGWFAYKTIATLPLSKADEKALALFKPAGRKTAVKRRKQVVA